MVSFGGLQKTDAATPSPSPSPSPVASHTASIITSTPVPTLARAGCPADEVDASTTDPGWLAFCSRCISSTATPVATIPSFHLGTTEPIGTYVSPTPVNTLPPLFVESTVVSATATAAPTNTPTVTPTPASYEVYWDFRVAQHGTEATAYTIEQSPYYLGMCAPNDWTGASTFSYGGGGYSSGYFVFAAGRCGGHFGSLQLPEWDALVQPGMTSVVVYGELMDNINWMKVQQVGGYDWAAPDDYNLSSIYGQGARGTKRWAWVVANSPGMTDLRGEIFQFGTVGSEFSITGLMFTYIGQPFVEGSFTPTPTYAPEPTSAAPSYDCSVALDYNVSDPVASVVTEVVEHEDTCYTIIPELNITATDPDIIYDGLQLCVQWTDVPTISIVGIEFALDLLLIIPAAYIIRKLLLM